MLVALQIVGAMMILAPFAAQQFGKLTTNAASYLWPNLIGSTLLAALAVIGSQWGFVLLECAWGAVAARSLLRANASDKPL